MRGLVMWELSLAIIKPLHNIIHPPEMEKNTFQVFGDVEWLPIWWGNQSNKQTNFQTNKTNKQKKRSHTQSSHRMEHICRCTVAYTG